MVPTVLFRRPPGRTDHAVGSGHPATDETPPMAASEHQVPLRAAAAPAEDIETFAARSWQPEAAGRYRVALPRTAMVLLSLVALNAALIMGRSEIVRYLPQTASLYAALGLPVNLRGLGFSAVTSTTDAHEGVPVIVVEGVIANAQQRVAEVPRLRFSIRNRAGQEVYAWTAMPSRAVLAPGETLAFRSRLASPPAGDARRSGPFLQST